MGREDLPSVRAAREQERERLQDVTVLSTRISQAIERVCYHNPRIVSFALYSTLDERERGIITIEQERETPKGGLVLTAHVTSDFLFDPDSSFAAWAAHVFDEAETSALGMGGDDVEVMVQ